MIARYELKFRLHHSQKSRFMSAARSGLCEDPHGVQACYRVSSVYFDSENLDFYWEKVDGESLRRKLRLRYYGDIDPAEGKLGRGPFFLELKHRIKDSVYKERVRLTTAAALDILHDRAALRNLSSLLDTDDPAALRTAASMESLHAKLNLRPANVITYLREAWGGRVDERLRVTFDRTANAYPPEAYSAVASDTGLPVIPSEWCVMEIKFNEVIPRWIRDIVIQQGLLPRRFSKYATGIESLRNKAARELSNQCAIADPTRDTMTIPQQQAAAAPRPPVTAPAFDADLSPDAPVL